MKRCTIGTRGSRLALAQAEMVRDGLRKAFPSIEFQLKTIKTKADKFSKIAFNKIEVEGIFTKEIEDTILRDEVDIGVHSLKDLPLEMRDGLTIAAVLKREDPRDALVSKTKASLADLNFGAKVGTSSPRRLSQLLRIRPELNVVPLRGNIETRLNKIKDGSLDAIVIACCGLKRLGLEKVITEYLDFDVMMPCVGQGALAAEARYDDEDIKQIVAILNDENSSLEIQAERHFLKRLGGGCHTPIGAIGKVSRNNLLLEGVVLSADGKRAICSKISGEKKDAVKIGEELAEKLLNLGAKDLLCS